MSRITVRGDHGIFMVEGWDFEINPDQYDHVQKVLERLAAYEDAEEGDKNMEILKVSSKSNANSVAGAITGCVRSEGRVEIQAIGAGALNQAVKAVAIARGFIAPNGVDLICIPAFADINIEGDERTAIKLIVEPRR